MNAKAFLVDALTSALDLGLATPDDVLRHVTTDVLAAHLPRPLWARLLTACFGAPRVDAQLVVDTVGVANLGEHLPPAILWACLAEIGARALAGTAVAAQPPVAMGTPSIPVARVVSMPAPLAIDSPPPPEPPKPARPAPVNPGPSIPSPSASPLAEIAADIDAELAASSPTPARTRTPTNRFRPSNTSNSIGRLAATRRPQASVPTPEPAPPPAARPGRRSETEADMDVETAVGDAADWRAALAVEDEQLVEWPSSESTSPSDDRKR